MSAIGRRMNHLRGQLSAIRNGPGAALLPATVTRLHLQFAHKGNNGHVGGRKFWQTYLPSLKFHNPAVPMIVNRVRDQDAAPTLTIYMTASSGGDDVVDDVGGGGESSPPEPLQLKGPKGAIKKPKAAVAVVSDPWVHIASSTDGSAPAPPAQQGESSVQINLRNVMSDDIWVQFVATTGATIVEPSLEDAEEMEKIAALEQQAEYDRRVQKAFRDEILKEKAMLERAKQEADALKGD